MTAQRAPVPESPGEDRALAQLAATYERPLTTKRKLTDQMTLDEFFRFGVVELFQQLASRASTSARREAWHGRTQELRQAVAHWRRVWREVHHTADPSLAFIAEHPAILRAYTDGLAALRGLSPQTRHNSVHRLNAVLRLAGPPEPGQRLYEYSLALVTSRLRAPTDACEVPEQIPNAWTDAELAAVFAWLSPLHDDVLRFPKIIALFRPWQFWRAYFGTLYYLGLRPAEAARIRPEHIRDGRLSAASLNRKQHQTVDKPLHPDLAADLLAVTGPRDWLFLWTAHGHYIHPAALNKAARAVLAAVPGITPERRLACKGLYGFRKKHFTDCERLAPGAGCASLRHSGPDIGRRSYRDARQIDGILPSLPSFRETPATGGPGRHGAGQPTDAATDGRREGTPATPAKHDATPDWPP